MIQIRPKLGYGLSKLFIFLSNTIPTTTQLHDFSASVLGLVVSLNTIRIRSLRNEDPQGEKKEKRYPGVIMAKWIDNEDIASALHKPMQGHVHEKLSDPASNLLLVALVSYFMRIIGAACSSSDKHAQVQASA